MLILIAASDRRLRDTADHDGAIAVRQEEQAEVVRALEEDIIFGRLRAGRRLVEDTLMARFRATRHFIRQALVELERLGIVVREQNKGATVRSLPRTRCGRSTRCARCCRARRRWPSPARARRR